MIYVIRFIFLQCLNKLSNQNLIIIVIIIFIIVIIIIIIIIIIIFIIILICHNINHHNVCKSGSINYTLKLLCCINYIHSSCLYQKVLLPTLYDATRLGNTTNPKYFKSLFTQNNIKFICDSCLENDSTQFTDVLFENMPSAPTVPAALSTPAA